MLNFMHNIIIVSFEPFYSTIIIEAYYEYDTAADMFKKCLKFVLSWRIQTRFDLWIYMKRVVVLCSIYDDEEEVNPLKSGTIVIMEVGHIKAWTAFL